MTQPIPEGQTPATLLALHDVAAGWFLRRQQPGWTADDERALAAWLDADPLHRDIYESMARIWQQADQLKAYRPEVYDRARAGAHVPAPAPAHRPVRSPGRRRFIPALASACTVLLAVGLWQRWDHTPGYALDVATGTGETRELALPDGSRVSLNVGSTLRVRYYPRRREAVLDQGEAFFQIAADAGRPFTVDSGPSQVRVVGTAFNVRAAPPQLRVHVLEGQVELRPDRQAGGGTVLRLGPGAGAGIDPATGRHQSLPLAPDDVGAWRGGQVRFSRAPLQEVAQELSRYLGRSVTLADPALAAIPISGFLAVKTPEHFLLTLPDVAPVRAERLADGQWRLLPR